MFSNQLQSEISHGGSHEILSTEPSTPCPDLAVKDYCIKHAAIFRELTDLRRRVSLVKVLSVCRPNRPTRDGRIPEGMIILEYNVIEQIMQMNLENENSTE
jgi:hypothetical protein